MPGLLIPKKSGVHRAACFALHRALLRQAAELPITKSQKGRYSKEIKSSTRANARLQGHEAIATALRVGYELLEAMHEGSRRSHILRRIERLPTMDSRSFVAAPVAARPKHFNTSKTAFYRLGAVRSPVLARPYRNISGRRRVPTLVNANRIPMLRISKPQSRLISHLIRSWTDVRHKRFDRMNRMSAAKQSGYDEDSWDRALTKVFGQELGTELVGDDKVSWARSFAVANKEAAVQYAEMLNKKRRVALKMTSIVEQEKQMAKEEREQRQQRRYRLKRIRYLEKHGRFDEARDMSEKLRADQITEADMQSSSPGVSTVDTSSAPVIRPSADNDGDSLHGR